MRRARKLLKLGTLLALALCLQSCGIFKKDVTLFPITGQDIVMLKEGETIVAPKQGAFLSDLYIETVMEVKIK